MAEAGVKARAAIGPYPLAWPNTQPLRALTAWTTALARTPSELSRDRVASGGRKSPPSFLSRALWGTGQTEPNEGRGSGDGTKKEASESLSPPRTGLGPA